MSAELIGGKDLRELYQQNGIDVSIDQTNSGSPRINVTLPKLDENSSKAICAACKKEGSVEYSSFSRYIRQNGVDLRFNNIQTVNVPNCRLNEIGFPPKEEEDEEFYECLDSCVSDKPPEGTSQQKIISDTVKYIRGTLEANGIRIVRPTISAVSNALQNNPQPPS